MLALYHISHFFNTKELILIVNTRDEAINYLRKQFNNDDWLLQALTEREYIIDDFNLVEFVKETNKEIEALKIELNQLKEKYELLSKNK